MITAIIATVLTGSSNSVCCVCAVRTVYSNVLIPGLSARCCYIVAMVSNVAPWDLHLLFEPKHGRQSAAPMGLGPESREWNYILPPPPLTAASAHEDGGQCGPPRKAARYEKATTFPDDEDIPMRPVIYDGRKGWPQARIDHSRAGDARLHEFFKKHNTFCGARVYIRASKGFSSSCSSSELEGGRHQHTDLPIAKQARRS